MDTKKNGINIPITPAQRKEIYDINTIFDTHDWSKRDYDFWKSGYFFGNENARSSTIKQVLEMVGKIEESIQYKIDFNKGYSEDFKRGESYAYGFSIGHIKQLKQKIQSLEKG